MICGILKTMICWNCKSLYEGEIFRTTECPSCKKDLHSCRNCRFYKPGSHFDCAETVEDPVTDKEKSNFCDFFKAKDSLEGESSGTSKSDEARRAAEALFGGSSSAPAKTGKDAFDALFG